MSVGSKQVGVGMPSGMRQATAFLNKTGPNTYHRQRQLPPKPAVIFDHFTGENNTDLTTHRPDRSPGGVTWSAITPDTGPATAGAATIKNNEANITVQAEGVAIDSGLANVDMEMDVRFGTGSRWGFIVRGVNNGNLLSVRIRNVESLIEVVDWTAGAATIVGTSETLSNTTGQTYNFRVRADGTQVSAWRDGVKVLNVTGVTAHQTATKQGFTSYGGTVDDAFDNFRVGPIYEGTPVP